MVDAIVISKMGGRRHGVKAPVPLVAREAGRAVDERRTRRVDDRWA
jgi:hypothetical protein